MEKVVNTCIGRIAWMRMMLFQVSQSISEERSRSFILTLKHIVHQKRHLIHITVSWIIKDYCNLRYKVISDQMRHIEFTEPYKWGITSHAEVDNASEQGHRKPCAAERLKNRYETNPPSEEVSGEADQSDEADPGSRHPVGRALKRCRSGAWNGTQRGRRGRRSRRSDCAG